MLKDDYLSLKKTDDTDITLNEAYNSVADHSGILNQKLH